MIKLYSRTFIFVLSCGTFANNFGSASQEQILLNDLLQAINDIDLNKVSGLLKNDALKKGINNSGIIENKTMAPLQLAIQKMEELSLTPLNIKDADYESKLINLGHKQWFLEQLINLLIDAGARIEQITDTQKQLPIVKEIKFTEIVNKLIQGQQAKTQSERDKITQQIIQSIKEYLDNGGKLTINANDDLLEKAIIYNNLPAFTQIIQTKQINPDTYFFHTSKSYPIIKAAGAGAETIIYDLIKKYRVDVNAKDARNEDTALLTVARKIHNYNTLATWGPNKLTAEKQPFINIMKVLLDAGAETKGLKEYVTLPTAEKPNPDYDEDIATYYKEHVREQEEYRRASPKRVR